MRRKSFTVHHIFRSRPLEWLKNAHYANPIPFAMHINIAGLYSLKQLFASPVLIHSIRHVSPYNQGYLLLSELLDGNL
jgi:hypothetical protein